MFQQALNAISWRHVCMAMLFALYGPTGNVNSDDSVEFFEQRVRPVLIEHCYACHSSDAKETKGGLRLDSRTGWQAGGDSGLPAIVPGKPLESPLWLAVAHAEGVSSMPPMRAKLPANVIADLKTWIENGATDPRAGAMSVRDKQSEWESVFRERLDWWSLKPLSLTSVPAMSLSADQPSNWARNEVDAFLLARMHEQALQPNAEADKAALARRLSVALIGLPPDPVWLAEYLQDDSHDAFDRLVSRLLDSPHFGERWARHWMDVVHYSDTHGYEWDVPVKNGWRYRDYLVRAFNADVPYRQLVLEQLAGDLITPRINTSEAINESLIGPLMLRLGERRHGDNSAAEGISQEAVSNMIDTIGKAFLGTTLACAQCHDHKLDAVEQRDYYSLAGMLMSARFSARPIDSDTCNSSNPTELSVHQHNQTVIDRLRATKASLKKELASRWLLATEVSSDGEMVRALRATAVDAKQTNTKPSDKKQTKTYPASLIDFWKRSQSSPLEADEFTAERTQRVDANAANLTLLVDFARPSQDTTWRWEGMGMQFGLVGDGELVVSDEGNTAVVHLLPAGRYTHAWSSRLAGSLQSPALDPTNPVTFSMQGVAGKFASQSFVVDRALNPERLSFPKRPFPVWQSLTAGNFDSLEGSVDRSPRRVYLELATKSLNNYFPPRVNYGGLSESELHDPRSWFGVSRIVQHAPNKQPQDDLTRFQPLFDEFAEQPDWALRLTQLLRRAVKRWSSGLCDSHDVQLINDAIEHKLLPVELVKDSEIERLVAEYRRQEKEIRVDQTVGTLAQWPEASDERLAVRGVYTDLGETIPRGHVRFLEPIDAGSAQRGAKSNCDNEIDSSGRLSWAKSLVEANSHLTARVYVNRVWHYLFGAGLVRTPDDFGHLGDPPTHPELLDYLAARFIREGWSTKRLIRMLVSSSAWRQSSVVRTQSIEIDPENRLWHHMPIRRLDAEALRDSLMTISGQLDHQLFGEPIEPYRTAEDAMKRLFKGPLDGQGRRSIYLEMTLMEPPRFLALFNQPLPKQTVGRRDVTNVPDQALAMLNDPFVIEMTERWSKRLIVDGSATAQQRAARMIQSALSRTARDEEALALAELVRQLATQREIDGNLLENAKLWQDAAHAVFNLKEFLYVP